MLSQTEPNEIICLKEGGGIKLIAPYNLFLPWVPHPLDGTINLTLSLPRVLPLTSKIVWR